MVKFSEYENKRKVNAWCPTNVGKPEDYGLYSKEKSSLFASTATIPYQCLYVTSITRDDIV